ncbi:MAG: LLM class flavin-dependent oxidoreductase [Microbacteriaceae bacterium]
MRIGYWTPVYGGFLRNVAEEGDMEASWRYVKRVSQLADRLGYDITLVPELYLNDRKGVEAPSLEAWSLSAAIAAVTERLRIMTAVRPGFHLPTVVAKTAATLADISGGRLSLNVVSAWWAEEARQYGGSFAAHEERYLQSTEFVRVLRGMWSEQPFSAAGRFYTVEGAVLSPKPAVPPLIFAGGESQDGREAIAGFADAYVIHGGTPEEVRAKIADVDARRRRLQGAGLAEVGMAGYVIVRDTEAEARAELERITTIDPGSPGYASFEQFVANSHLDVELSRREYSVGTRGLRPGLVGTAEQVAERIRAFERAGVTLLLVQASPLDEELERIAVELFPLLEREPAVAAS